MPSSPHKPLGDAVAEATEAANELAAKAPGRKRGGRTPDALGGELRRRDLVPLLVFHLIRNEPSYGNHLIEAIEEITQGVISVNPNTMYPLLRELEGRGLIRGDWEHPDKRTRRFYSITDQGEEEYRRLRVEVEPFLDSLIGSIQRIKSAVYADPGT